MKRLDLFKTDSVLLPLLLALLWSFSLNAQNLVKNPSFEDFLICPSEFGCLERAVVSWHQPTNGSTDYFNSCSPSMSSETNFIGAQAPFDGHGYAGMYAYGPKDYREYLTAELKESLIPGQKYVFSFQVSLADESQYGVNEFGILFTDKPPSFQTKRNIPLNLMTRKKSYNYSLIRNHEFFANKKEWTEVTGVYIADGTERFLTIGNFNGNSKTRLLNTGKNLRKVAYYYVDMFFVGPLKASYVLDEVYVFENLTFDTDGYSIADEGEAQLNDLVEYLKAHRGFTVSVYGHTDDMGTKEYNKALSQKRAKTVADFLIEKGVRSNRIIWRGYGDGSPVVKNETEANREKNRRVEFVLSRKKKEYYASGTFDEDQ